MRIIHAVFNEKWCRSIEYTRRRETVKLTNIYLSQLSHCDSHKLELRKPHLTWVIVISHRYIIGSKYMRSVEVSWHIGFHMTSVRVLRIPGEGSPSGVGDKPSLLHLPRWESQYYKKSLSLSCTQLSSSTMATTQERPLSHLRTSAETGRPPLLEVLVLVCLWDSLMKFGSPPNPAPIVHLA